jgi:guanosine-3',5'-bis(diphosphate) 3'-pyrophosphohydrolase
MDRSDAEATGRLLEAAAFAARKHKNQRRKGEAASPYINHPLAVAWLLWDVGGVRDATTLVAAILHDTLEDTDTGPVEIQERFGPAVLSIVQEVTDDKSLPKARRKALQVEHAAESSTPAKLIKLADKTHNLRELTADPPADWPRARSHNYVVWARRVVDGVRGVNAPLEAAFDEAVQAALQQYGEGQGQALGDTDALS